MKLNTLQRLMLSSQLRVLEALDPAAAPELARRRAALEGGFALEYDWVASRLEPEVPEAECLVVRETLELFAALATVDTGRLDPAVRSALAFGGFDPRHERDALRYARFLLGARGLFPALAGTVLEAAVEGARLPRYRRMVARWRELGSVPEPSAADAVAIARAGDDPS